MTGILTDPKVLEAVNGLVAVLIVGLGSLAAVGFARLKNSMESHLQRATRAAEEAKRAAQSADALDAHGESLSDMKARIDRIDERGGRMDAEIHDERTAREAATRLIDAHAHDTHKSIYERLDALEARAEK